MTYKTSKILSIIAGCIVFAAFFMPWTKSLFGLSISGWEILKMVIELFSEITELPKDLRVYLPLLLVTIPICSISIVVYSLMTIDKENNASRDSKVIIVFVVFAAAILMLYTQFKNPYSDFTNIFDLLGTGVYLTFAGIVYFLIDLLTTKKKITANEVQSTSQNVVFCSSCGKKHNADLNGKYCDQCGEEI